MNSLIDKAVLQFKNEEIPHEMRGDLLRRMPGSVMFGNRAAFSRTMGVGDPYTEEQYPKLLRIKWLVF